MATHAIESSILAEANEVNHSHASEDADGKNSHKDLTSYDEIFDDDSTCSESFFGGDLINYYDPISVSGDPKGLREATVLAIDPDDDYPLTLSSLVGNSNFLFQFLGPPSEAEFRFHF